MRHVVLGAVAAGRNGHAEAVLDRIADGVHELDRVGHRLEIGEVLERVAEAELVRLAIAFDRVAHEGLVEAAIHAAAADDTVEDFGRQARLGRERQGFGVDRGVAQRHEVVEELHLVARADLAEVDELGAGPGLEHRLDARKNLGRGADHGTELAFCGLHGRTAERRVGKRDARCGELFGESRGRGGIGGRGVDDHRARLEVRLESVGTAHQRFDFARSGDAEENDGTAFRDFACGTYLNGATRNQVLDRRTIAMGDDAECVALLDDIPGDAVTHEAKADEADGFSHALLPVMREAY
jgi:hypothetical protein